MPRRKRSSSPFELFDDELDEELQRNGNPPIQRNAANARERARMRVLSSAFGRLKTKLPNIPPDTKLSKLDTLRLATMYIKQLRALAEGSNATTNGSDAINMQFTEHNNLIASGAHNLTWPFGLHHIQSPPNRQQPLHQGTTMDWSSQIETAKCNENHIYATTQHQPQTFANWYNSPTTNSSSPILTHNFHTHNNNNYNNCNNVNQSTQQHSNQNQLMHNYATNSMRDHHQHYQSAIR